MRPLRLLLLLLALSPCALAQPTQAPRTDYLGGTVGLGGGVDEAFGGLISTTFSIDYRRGFGIVSFRGLAAIGDAFAMADLGLLIGPGYGEDLGRVWFGIGPALTTVGVLDPCYGSFFTSCDTPELDPGGNTLGLAVAFRVYAVEFEHLKVGLYGYSNFNPIQDFQGVTLTFQRGWALR